MIFSNAIERPATRHGRIVKAVWTGTAARVMTSGVSLLSLPLVVRYLGPERYGVWATITTTAVWINLLDLGIANTLTNHISRAYAQHDEQLAGRSFTNALVLTGAVTVFAGVACAALFPHINWIALLNVSSNMSARELKETVAIAAALMLLGLPCNLSSKLLAGYQKLHINNYAAGIAALASLAGLAAGVLMRVQMPVLYLMSVGGMTFSSMGVLVLVIWRKRWLLPRPSLIDFSIIRSLLASGSAFFLIQVAAVVVFSSDNLIVSHYLGAAEVTPYSVTWRLAGLAAVLQSLIFPALWPAYAEAYAKRQYGWIRRAFAVTMKGIVVLNVLCALLFVFFGRSLIRIWAGPAAVPSTYLLIAMSVWIVVNGFMSVESCLLAALNRTREQAVLSILAAAANVALSLALVHHIGSLGVIAGTIISYVAVLVVPQSLIVRNVWNRELADEEDTPLAFRSSPSALRFLRRLANSD